MTVSISSSTAVLGTHKMKLHFEFVVVFPRLVAPAIVSPRVVIGLDVKRVGVCIDLYSDLRKASFEFGDLDGFEPDLVAYRSLR